MNADAHALSQDWDYQPPVRKLLTLGEPMDVEEVDYLELGVDREDIPELIRLATDPRLLDLDVDTADAWAPVHAWRVLASLHAVEAIEPLLSLLHRVDDEGDDWVAEEVSEALAAIGPAALPAVSTYLADQTHGPDARSVCADVVGLIGQKYTQSRDECVSVLTNQLELFMLNTPLVNSMLVWSLVELKAVEAAPVMERAFAADAVQKSMVGDWEDIQVELGLKATRDTPPRSYWAEGMGISPELTDLLRGNTALPAARDPRRDLWQVEKRKRNKNKSKAKSKQKRQQKKQKKHKKK